MSGVGFVRLDSGREPNLSGSESDMYTVHARSKICPSMPPRTRLWLTVHIFQSEWAKQFVELGRNFSPSTNSGERGTKELVKKGNILWFQGLKIEEKKFARRKSCLFSKGFFLFFFLIYFSSSFSLLSTPNRKYSNVC